MAWVRISDASGSVEVTCFSEVLNRSRELLASGSNLLVTAELKTEGEAVRVTAMDVVPLDRAAASAGASIRVWLGETAAVPHIRDSLGRESGGRGRVTWCPGSATNRMWRSRCPAAITLPRGLAQALKSLPGVDQVEEV